MTRPVSLAHLTVLGVAPPEMVRMAARIGYDGVGLRLIAVTDTTPGYSLMTDRAMLRNTKVALNETGIRVLDIEFVKITPDFDVADYKAFFEAGEELGAAYVITAPYDPDLSRLSDRLAMFAEASAGYGLNTVLEFFPWTCVPDLSAAVHVAEAAGRPDIGILVDTLHFDRSGSLLEDLSGLDTRRLPFVHVCDAPVLPSYSTEDLLHAGRAERLPPGEGNIDIGGILSRMPADIPIALEVPMTEATKAMGPEFVARRCFEALKGSGACRRGRSESGGKPGKTRAG